MTSALQRVLDFGSKIRSQQGGDNPKMGNGAGDALSMSSMAAKDFTAAMSQANVTQLEGVRATEQFQSMMGRARRTLTDYNQDITSSAKASQTFNDAMQKQELALLAASTQLANFNQKAQLAGAPTAVIDQATNAFQRLQQQLQTGAASEYTLANATAEFRAEMANANRGLTENQAKMQSDAEATKQYESALKGVNTMMSQLSRQQNAISGGSDKLANFTQRAQLGGGSPESINAATQAFQQYENTLKAGVLSTQQFAAANATFTSGMQNSARILREHQRAVEDGHVGTSRFAGAMSNLATAAQLGTGPLSGLAFRITTLSNLFQQGSVVMALWVAGLGAAGYALYQFSQGAVANELKLLSMREQLLSLSGSTVTMKEDLQNVIEVSNRFGISFEKVVDNFRDFVLAARGTSLEGAGVKRLFEDIMAISGKLSFPEKQTEDFLNFTSRAVAKGQINWGEMRRELTRIIPNSPEIAQRALGMDADSMKRAFDRGQIIASQFFPKFAAQIMKDFNIDKTTPVDNLRATINRLKTEWSLFNNTMDQTFGFSDSTEKWTQRLTNALSFLRDNIITVTAALAGFGTAVTLAFAFPTIIAGLAGASRGLMLFGTTLASIGSLLVSGGLMGGVRALTAAMTTLSLVTLATPIGWLIRLGLAVGGGYLAFTQLNSSLTTNQEKLVTAKQSLGDYIKGLEDSVKTARELNEEIAKTKVSQAAEEVAKAQKAKAAAETAIKDTEEKIKAVMKRMEDIGKTSGDTASENFWDAWSKKVESGAISGGMGGDRRKKLRNDAQGDLQGLEAELQRWRDILEAGKGDLSEAQKQATTLAQALDNVRKHQQGAPKDDVPENQTQTRVNRAIRDVQELSGEWEREFDAMKKGPKALADTMHDVEIEKSLRQMKDQLERAGLSAAEAAPLLERYGAAVKKLKDAQYFDKNFVFIGKFIGDSFKEAATTGVNQFVDALYNGQLNMLKLGDIARTVLSSITKKFLEMAFINPLINSLFGTTFQSLSFNAGGTGTGGLLGGMNLKHGGSGVSSFRLGGDPSVFWGAPRLHSGLMPDEFPAILQHGEEVIPKGGRGAGDTYMVEQHIHYAGPPPEDPVKQRQLQDASRRSLESMMDGRIAQARRPGGIISGGRG